MKHSPEDGFSTGLFQNKHTQCRSTTLLVKYNSMRTQLLNIIVLVSERGVEKLMYVRAYDQVRMQSMKTLDKM